MNLFKINRMAFQYVAKKVIPCFRSYTFFNPFTSNSSLCVVSILPCQIRKFHISPNLFKELVRFNLADIGEGIKEVLIKEWYIKVGDRVSQFNNICEVQSDKATVTITSRYDGLVKKIYYEIDETAIVGKPLIDIELDIPMEEENVASDPVCESADFETLEAHKGPKVCTTPSIRKLAKENNINLADVTPTGPHDRILKEDVMNYVNSKSQQPSHSLKDSPKFEQQISNERVLPKKSLTASNKTELSLDKTVPIKGLQKTMMKMMNKSRAIPDFSFCDEIDVTLLSEMRNRIYSKKSDIKLTYMPFFIKAASNAILQFPQLNAHLDESCENLIYKASHNIGFAVDSPEGLVVPKIHDAQNKSIKEISQEMNDLIQKAKAGKLSVSDISNGTFTLSNIGNIGGTYTCPVILSPEIVIGGIGKIQKLPRFNEKDEVVAAQIMQISWTADHRVVDGATIARFSNLWKLYLEKPEMFIINNK